MCRYHVVMQLDRPFRVVTATLDGEVLSVLARAEAEFTPSELRVVLGSYSSEGIRKVLKRLVAQGIVVERRVANARSYRLNRAHIAAPAVEALASLKGVLVEKMRDRLAAWPTPPVYAALFGSGAGGDMQTDSDLDVFIVRPPDVDPEEGGWEGQLASFVRDVADWTGNDVRVVEYGADELTPALRTKERVLRDIADTGIRLVGPVGFLARLARSA